MTRSRALGAALVLLFLTAGTAVTSMPGSGAATARAKSSLSAPRLAPAAPIVREKVAVSGTLAPAARRRIQLQAKSGSTWRTLAAATSDARGRVSVVVPFKVASTIRWYAAPSGGKPAVTGPTKRVAPLAQTLSVSAPARVRPGTSVTVTVTAAPARPGRPITVDAVLLAEGEVISVGSATQDAQGKASFPLLPEFHGVDAGCSCAPFQLRATTPSSNGAPAVKAQRLLAVGQLLGTAAGAVGVVGRAPDGTRPSGHAAEVSADGGSVLMMARPSGFGSSDLTSRAGLWRVDLGTGSGTPVTLPLNENKLALWPLVTEGGYHRVYRPWNASADLGVVALDMNRHDAEGTPCVENEYCYAQEFDDGYVLRDGTMTRLTDAYVEASGIGSWSGGTGQLGVFPGGDRVVIRDTRVSGDTQTQVLAVAAQGGGETDFSEDVSQGVLADPAVPADGSFLAYGLYAQPSQITGTGFATELDLVPASGGTPQVVCDDPAIDHFGAPVVSADGGTLVFAGESDFIESLYSCDLATDDVTWIDFYGSGADVSDTGRYIAYQSPSGNGSQVKRYDRSTGTTAVLAVSDPIDPDEDYLYSPVSMSGSGGTVVFLADNTGLLGAAQPSQYSFNTFAWTAS